MAGHSHWAGIKHKKAANDAKRGVLWSKLSKAIIMAAQLGGGDPDANFRLRQAIDDAKAGNLPKDSIVRAVKKGTGELGGGTIEEVVYEGYGPNGVAVLCVAYTDNRNRTAPELRKIFEKADGKLGATGCVAWNFSKKGMFSVPADQTDEETLMDVALEAGAEDVSQEGESFTIMCGPDEYAAVSEALAAAKIKPEVSNLGLVPGETVDLDKKTAVKVIKMMEEFDEHDDVQDVSANFNIPDDVMAELNG
jgi:YebC/PmpR family DNA-binding regulatory protein